MTEKPKIKDKPEYVNCMACKNYDDVDTWCITFNKPMKGYRDEFTCRKFMPID